jgi:hypothetical protein
VKKGLTDDLLSMEAIEQSRTRSDLTEHLEVFESKENRKGNGVIGRTMSLDRCTYHSTTVPAMFAREATSRSQMG